jgi:lysophospholipase L1-like esterase
MKKVGGFPVILLCVVIAVAVAMAAIRAAAPRVVIIGDSTAYTYPASDSLRGWGQELGYFFKQGAVAIINKSIGGRSSRSFVEDGHWASTKDILKKGDILLISFGTNDRGTVPERHADTAQFRQYLTQYVNESRAMGAIPVLISTVNQNSWSAAAFVRGYTTGVNDYRGAMLRVVEALDVPFIDLEQKSADLFKSLGQKYLSDFFFIGGNTHFREMGAVGIAKLVAEGIKELADDPEVGPLSVALAPQYMVTVTSNKSGAGMITASAAYPQNAPITLQVQPGSGQTFECWQDETGTSLSTQKLFTFSMGTAARSYVAVFKGGTAIASRAAALTAKSPPVAVSLSGAGIASIDAFDEIISVRVTDVSGKCILSCKPMRNRASLDLAGLARGWYMVSVRTAAEAATCVTNVFLRINGKDNYFKPVR